MGEKQQTVQESCCRLLYKHRLFRILWILMNHPQLISFKIRSNVEKKKKKKVRSGFIYGIIKLSFLCLVQPSNCPPSCFDAWIYVFIYVFICGDVIFRILLFSFMFVLSFLCLLVSTLTCYSHFFNVCYPYINHIMFDIKKLNQCATHTHTQESKIKLPV